MVGDLEYTHRQACLPCQGKSHPDTGRSLQSCIFIVQESGEGIVRLPEHPLIQDSLANPFTGDGTKHPDEHLIYVDEVCGLFKLAGIPDGVAKKKVFPLSLKGVALIWYRLCDDTRSWNYKRLKLEFHQKYYPMHLVHRDRNYIYNFWPREGESIAQAWGRLKSMLYSCPNHGFPRETIIQNLYVGHSENNCTMLDTSCAGSFMMKNIEFKWDLLD